MSDDDFLMGGAIGVILSMVLIWVLFCIFEPVRTSTYRDEAVQVGVAEYYLDANHNRQFRWLTNQVKGNQ